MVQRLLVKTTLTALVVLALIAVSVDVAARCERRERVGAFDASRSLSGGGSGLTRTYSPV